ncbi:MAG: FAD:protein FMN transferase, partial [Flavobacteriales bacterium]
QDSVSQAAFEACLEEVDVEMNTWRPSSTLSQFNGSTEVGTAFSFADSAGVWEDVWRISEDVHRLSGGAFDVTVGPLMKLWGFRMERRDVVTPTMVDSVRQFAHFASDVIRFVPKSRAGGAALSKSDPRTELDFNAVAQGYTVDAMAQVLLDRGVTNMMVELGGEVKCLGLNQHSQPWRIAIDRPQEEGRTLQAVLPVADMSICTSGNYRKVSVVNGQRFSHTLDPRTGTPVTHGLLSATVVASEAAYADAFATACMVLGPEAGQRWIAQMQAQGEEVEALFIMDGAGEAFTYWATPSLEAQLEWLEPLDKYDPTLVE